MTDQMILRLAIGAAISVILAVVSVRIRSLSLNGGVGATVIGTVIFANGGWSWYVVLLTFFLSSSCLTRFRYSTKAATGVGELRAGSRSLWQTVGQGGVAVLIAGIALLSTTTSILVAAAFVGALAEANADTWAVEIGVLSKGNPRMITKLSRAVPAGTSGGVSAIGEASACAGAFCVALVGAFLGVLGPAPLVPLLVAGFAAILGEHFDSLLGATVQAVYYCPNCKEETERRIHRCGIATDHVKGFGVLTNEAVNFISTCIAATIAVTVYFLL